MKKRKKYIFGISFFLIVMSMLIFLLINKKENKNIKAAIVGNLNYNNASEITEVFLKEGIGEADSNTEKLQKAIDKVSESGGGTVHIPAGEYYFSKAGIAKSEGNTANWWYYAILLKNNVTIEGEGIEGDSQTILKPYGNLERGLDLFYEEYSDSNINEYLTNANFKNFIIDGSESEILDPNNYNAHGKGFMIFGFKNCTWSNVVVKNTDGTGFGIDEPINCKIENCYAYGCGKVVNRMSKDRKKYGASGFGIGIGFSDDESMEIVNCVAIGNGQFGFFFEHQSRFESKYAAKKAGGFLVLNCIAAGNRYDFGGEKANDLVYQNCMSLNLNSNKYKDLFGEYIDGISEYNVVTDNEMPFYFGTNSRRIKLLNCTSEFEYANVDKTSEELYWAVNHSIIDAKSQDNTYEELEECTRAIAITMLWRLNERAGDVLGYGDKVSISEFTDVEENAFYVDALRWGIDKKIIDTGNNAEFLPNDSCRKKTIITYLWRCAEKPNVNVNENSCKDIEKETYYEKAAYWALEQGLVEKDSDGNFLPDEVLSKTEIIKLLYKYSRIKMLNDTEITLIENADTFDGNTATSILSNTENKIILGGLIIVLIIVSRIIYVRMSKLDM